MKVEIGKTYKFRLPYKSASFLMNPGIYIRLDIPCPIREFLGIPNKEIIFSGKVVSIDKTTFTHIICINHLSLI
jgi:hypothetical protein